MALTKKNWKNFRRKEWRDFFVEMHLICWTFGITAYPEGHKHLYCIELGCFTIGYEYKTRAYRLLEKRTKLYKQ